MRSSRKKMQYFRFKELKDLGEEVFEVKGSRSRGI